MKKKSLYFYLSIIKIVFYIILASLLRAVQFKTKSKNIIILYGHLLDGNLKALFEYSLNDKNKEYEMSYLTLDSHSYVKLKREYEVGILCGNKFKNIQKVVEAKCIITSHGPMALYVLRFLRPNTHFIDVWHGIAFKDYRPIELSDMQFYKAYFASSESFKNFYVKYRGYDKNKVFSLGMAKHDFLFSSASRQNEIIKDLGIENFKKIILYAPTHWGGKSGNIQNEIPFGIEKNAYLNRLNKFAKEKNYLIIFRLHQNSNFIFDDIYFSNLKSISQIEYPDTNKLLISANLLITDWSSIASDYSALDRPIIYLDVPPPITYNQSGFPLPMDRGGIIVNSFSGLLENINLFLKIDEYSLPESQVVMKDIVFGDNYDGNSTKRCIDKIIELVSID